MANHISVSVEDRILTVRMDRLEKKNALSREMYAAMIEALRQGDADPSVRLMVITGTGDCFTAGNDLADFATPRREEESVAITYLKTLAATKKPVMAAVAGVAVGIGTTMLLHCDLVYAASTARFQMPFVNLGLCPEAGSSVILPVLMGHRRAAELLYFGDPFTAETAHELGLVNEVCAPEELTARVKARAKQLAEKPPASLSTTKALLKHATSGAILEAMTRETQNFAALLQGPEAREAMTAFMERRKPDFSRF